MAIQWTAIIADNIIGYILDKAAPVKGCARRYRKMLAPGESKLALTNVGEQLRTRGMLQASSEAGGKLLG